MNALRGEVEQLQGQLDRLTSEHAALKVHTKSIEEAYARLKELHTELEGNL